jgi:lysophospholipase L1-like esterase
VPVAEYESNVAQLVQALRALNASVRVVVIAPPPVDAASYVAKFITPRALQKGLDPASVPVDRSDERVVPYVEACRRVAEAQGVPLVDTFAAIHAAARKGAPLASFFSDGLHLSAEGNAVVYDTLAAAIKQHAPELHVRPCPFTGNAANSGSSCDALSPMAPFWDKIDPAAGAGRFLDAHFAASPRSPKRQRREA